MTFFETAKLYIGLGFTHVIPFGTDHILFILCIFFLNSNLRTVIIQCTVFTLAHSLSLIMASMNLIKIDAAIIEALIALSILVMAIENIVQTKVNKWRLLLIFIFGLIHGLGFANALKDIGISGNYFITSLLFFNLGVELAQLSLIVCAYIFISRSFGEKGWYRERVVYPISTIIGCVALYWTIERVFYQ